MNSVPARRAVPLDTALQALRQQGRKAFAPYLMAGYPDRRTFLDAAQVLVSCGADLIEIGVPFSDPLADGPVIQAAGKTALEHGVNPDTCLDLVHELHTRQPGTPLVLMAYVNTILASGGARYLARAAAAGVQGLIIPDLDLARADETQAIAGRAGLALIRLLAPITPTTRARHVLARAQGFAYLISVTGVTGARHRASFDLGRYVHRMRKLTDLPLYVGFGVSNANQARSVCAIADGVVVGSALLEALRGHPPLRMLRELCAALRSGCDRAGAEA